MARKCTGTPRVYRKVVRTSELLSIFPKDGGLIDYACLSQFDLVSDSQLRDRILLLIKSKHIVRYDRKLMQEAGAINLSMNLLTNVYRGRYVYRLTELGRTEAEAPSSKSIELSKKIREQVRVPCNAESALHGIRMSKLEKLSGIDGNYENYDLSALGTDVEIVRPGVIRVTNMYLNTKRKSPSEMDHKAITNSVFDMRNR